jgi:hypothetical protein
MRGFSFLENYMSNDAKSSEVKESSKEKSYQATNPALKFTMLKVYLSGRPFTRLTGPMKFVTK